MGSGKEGQGTICPIDSVVETINVRNLRED